MKKIIALVLIAASLFALTVPSFAADSDYEQKVKKVYDAIFCVTYDGVKDITVPTEKEVYDFAKWMRSCGYVFGKNAIYNSYDFALRHFFDGTCKAAVLTEDRKTYGTFDSIYFIYKAKLPLVVAEGLNVNFELSGTFGNEAIVFDNDDDTSMKRCGDFVNAGVFRFSQNVWSLMEPLTEIDKLYVMATFYYTMLATEDTVLFYHDYMFDPEGSDAVKCLDEDVNYDGAFNSKDSSYLKKYIAGIEDKINPVAADFNGDGVISSKDIKALKTALVG